MNNADKLARQVGERMLAKDASTRFFGVVLEEIRAGYARMAMDVTADMLNGLELCHGGFTFKLADDAFAYACNSYDLATVGTHCTISYPAAARLGDRLTAEAREIHRRGRSGIDRKAHV